MINPIRKSLPANTWSTEDIRLLRQLAIDGAPLETIAVRLRRTRSAIRNKATMHGISLRRCGTSLSSQQAASA
ncbi:MAG TPA: hypothetical protein VGE08_19165 [Steroidobacter sp.]|uniref:hypothetical protein n=1 Tax=Steroidobacter sp. TaxID=1978227 RepID=UPI002EDBA150